MLMGFDPWVPGCSLFMFRVRILSPTLYSSQECFLLVTEAGDLVGVSAQLFSPASVDAFQSQASPTGELIYAGKRYGNNNILGPDTILLTTGMDGTCFVGAANSGGVWQWGIGFSNEFGVVPHKMAIGPNGEVALVTYVVNAGNPALAVGTVGSSIASALGRPGTPAHAH